MLSSPKYRAAAAAGVLTAAVVSAAVPALTSNAGVAAAAMRSLYVNGIASDNVTRFGVRPDGVLAGPREHTPTGGGARGIVLSPDGRTAYVAAGFDPKTEIDASQVVAFRVGAGGGLSPLGTPLAAQGDPVSLALTPDGRTMYLTNRGSETISTFRVGADGRLSELAPPMPSGAVDPQGEAVTPDGHFLFVSHRGDPDDTDVVTRFAIGGDGRLTPLGRPARIGKSGGTMAITSDGRFLYVPAQDSNQVFGFRVGADGSLRPVPGSPFRAPDFPIGANATPNGRWLYVADGGTVDSGFRQISAFAIQADGRLRRIAEFTAGESPTALTITPDGHRLYAANLTSDDVSGFDIGATGALTEIPGSPFGLDGGEQPAQEAIAITPNQGPTAAFTTVPRRHGGVTGFDATAATDPDGRVARFDWKFGDGTVLPNGGPRPAHAYARPGTFTVTLTVTDNEGCSTRLVYTGMSVSCNGSATARSTRAITVER